MKVAGYCRVSTDKDDQANSFDAQQRYFTEYIQRTPEWELYNIYADEGISGTSIKKRTQFVRMICDAYEGKFHLIVTKEVSRFSRNIVDTITYTRELRAIGVGVIFLTDGINTLDPDAELRLSIIASIAQEESRRISARVVWGQTRQMERGVVFGKSMLGYDVKDGKLTINPKGAALVRLIFEKYAIEQVGTTQIAKYLIDHGFHTYHGSAHWSANKLIKILKNEKYVGDLVQKKTYTPDYLTHEKRRNTGQVPLIRMINHHEPIISREIWDLTQKRLRQNNRHSESMHGHSNRYVFSGKITCGECGSSFVGRQKQLKDGTKIRRWHCGKASAGGKAACDVGRLVRDDDAIRMLQTALRHLNMDKHTLEEELTALVMRAVLACKEMSSDQPEYLQCEIDRIQQKKEKLLDRYLSGVISQDDMLLMNKNYDNQLTTLRDRLNRTQKQHSASQKNSTAIREEIHRLLNGQQESEVFYRHLLDHLTVFKDRHLELQLKHLPHVFRYH